MKFTQIGVNIHETVTNYSQMLAVFKAEKCFPSVYTFTHPQVIRQDTGLVRNHANAGSWRVKPSPIGISIWPAHKGNSVAPPLISWSAIKTIDVDVDGMG
ncbi:hypothetical protein [Levilactobacillus spicheri]|uniref:Uncharacterized protein n=1 Tax=Levilactobacillus spicheri TaxID=216463 RepID=A0A0F3RTP3_9LACO|nr:hypothetical protein [Levilactobacillus spicheri]KJW13346.1 hypothetical protein VC81_02445 [Levilactobacillus spicheri]